MIPVMIVDDNIISRNQLQSIINWENNDFKIVAEAINGKDALEKFEKYNPLLVITDISMPKMDGVELCKRLSKKNNNVQFIIISSYNNYDYLRDTFKTGAHDYLLKTELSPKILIKTLKDIKNKIETFSQTNTKYPSEQKIADYLLGVEKEFVGDIIDELKLLNLRDNDTGYTLFAFRIFYYQHITKELNCAELAMHVRSLKDLIDKQFTEVSHITFWMGSGHIAILTEGCKYKSAYKEQQKISEFASRVNNCLVKFMDCKAQYSIAHIRNNELKGAYKKIVEKMNTNTNIKSLTSSVVMDIVDSFQQLNEQKCFDSLNRLFVILRENKTDMWNTQLIIISVLNLIDRLIEWEDMSIGEYNRLLCKIYHSNILASIEKTMICLFKFIWGGIKIKKERKYSYAIKAKEYIKKNYCKPMTLSKVAKYVGIAPNYLSNQFSNEIGMTVIEYLNKIRIEKAEFMMKSEGALVKEVYQKVGFKSYNYFFKVYKNIMGISPAKKNR